MNATLRIAWIAVRELLYERVFYILVFFAALSLGVSLLLGQMTYAEQAKLTLDFMLGATEISMVLFSVFMGISLFHRELTLGSVSMVLSKPISRASFLLGKYVGQLAVQAAVTLAMALFTIAICSRFEAPVPVAPIFQTCLLILFEVAVLTAITFFFAVNAGAVTSAVATLCLFSIGHLRETVSKSLTSALDISVWRIVKGLVPDLEVFNMKALASYGFSLPMDQLGWAALYAVCCVAFFLVMAAVCFQRRDIQT